MKTKKIELLILVLARKIARASKTPEGYKKAIKKARKMLILKNLDELYRHQKR